MFDNIFKKSLINVLPQVRGKYLKNVPLSKHTWFGVGGPAEVMFIPEDQEDLSHFLQQRPYNVPICLIGGGSNLLVRDGGIPGVVIKLDSPYFRQVFINNDSITCYAGLKNIDLKKILLTNELGGLEFLCSIPGCIGTEAFLSYIGLGISETTLGKIINTAQGALTVPGWEWEFWCPVLLSAFISIVLFLVGQGLGDAADPRTHVR